MPCPMVSVRAEVSGRARARFLEEPWQAEAVGSLLPGFLTDSESGVHRDPRLTWNQGDQSMEHMSPLITLEQVQ